MGRLRFLTALGLALGLAGCARARAFAELDARAGASADGLEALIEAELRSCVDGAVERCEELGLWLLERDAPRPEAFAALDRGCAAGRSASCEGIVDIILAARRCRVSLAYESDPAADC